MKSDHLPAHTRLGYHWSELNRSSSAPMWTYVDTTTRDSLMTHPSLSLSSTRGSHGLIALTTSWGTTLRVTMCRYLTQMPLQSQSKSIGALDFQFRLSKLRWLMKLSTKHVYCVISICTWVGENMLWLLGAWDAASRHWSLLYLERWQECTAKSWSRLPYCQKASAMSPKSPGYRYRGSDMLCSITITVIRSLNRFVGIIITFLNVN